MAYYLYGRNDSRKKKDKVAGLVNTNRLVKEYHGTTGIKTGSTSEAKYCLSASAKRGGNLHLIAVILGADNSRIRFDESMRLLDYGFANYDSIPIGRKKRCLWESSNSKGKYGIFRGSIGKGCLYFNTKGKGWQFK